MNSDIAIKFVSVSLSYKSQNARQTLKNAFLDKARSSRNNHGLKYQISNFSIEIKHGEQVGIIGRNGSGKSTFLKLISGVLIPDSGSIAVDGSITPLIDIGAGMHPDLTCLENIYLSGSYLGLTRREINSRLDEIISWAEISTLLDKPYHALSTGTQSRIAFSVSTSLVPEIVLVDEVLSVGDIGFQLKSKTRMQELKSAGSAVLIVSHDLEYLSKEVDRVIWIDKGNLTLDGEAHFVLSEYKKSF